MEILAHAVLIFTLFNTVVILTADFLYEKQFEVYMRTFCIKHPRLSSSAFVMFDAGILCPALATFVWMKLGALPAMVMIISCAYQFMAIIPHISAYRREKRANSVL